MNIVRFYNKREQIVMGVLECDNVYDLSDVLSEDEQNIFALYQKLKPKKKTITSYIQSMNYKTKATVYTYESVRLVTPIESPEVWACGVTYEKSRVARNSEMKHKTADIPSVYDKVYDASRPELFLKSTPLRTAHPNGAVCIRTDSEWQIPEPEVGLVLNKDGEIIGYTAGNDMSSRDIEGENPLYLPQAKVWRNSCSFGPSIRLAESVNDPYQLSIRCRIYRADECVFEGQANTSQLKRKYEELVHYLLQDNVIEDGTVLLTGTCVVPPDHFTLRAGDIVEIDVDTVGTLRNTVTLAHS